MIDLKARVDRLADEQRMIQESAASFFSAEGDYKRIRARRGVSPGYDQKIWEDMAKLGWLGLCLPEKYNGSGLGFAEASLLLEQGGRALAPEPFISAALLAGGAVLHGDNDDLKAQCLPRLAAGGWKPALAWQEAASSQQAESTMVTAVAAGGGFTLTGSKHFIPAAEGADAFVVAARASAGTALFLVDKGSAGTAIETHPRVDGGFFGTLRLSEVRVPASRCVASPTVGKAVLERVLDEGRLAVSAELLGVMSRALEISVAYIRQREQFGRPVGSFQALQHRAVDLFILTELSRSVLVRSALVFDAGEDPTRRAIAASQAKARCSDAALKVAKGCVQLHGGIGYADECDIGLFLKKSMVLAAWLGSAAYHRRRYGELVPETAQ